MDPTVTSMTLWIVSVPTSQFEKQLIKNKESFNNCLSGSPFFLFNVTQLTQMPTPSWATSLCKGLSVCWGPTAPSDQPGELVECNAFEF